MFYLFKLAVSHSSPLLLHVHLHLFFKTSCERMDPIRKTSGFAYGPLIKQPPSLRKISYKYNSMLTYILVSFLFSVIFRVRVRVKNRVRVMVQLARAETWCDDWGEWGIDRR